ncbi:MAG: cytochrome C [Rhodothermia bacterium]
MKRFLKWAGIIFGSLLAILLIAVGAVYVLSDRDLNSRYEIEPVAISIPEPDSTMLARGRHVSEVRGCTGCHGKNLGGEVMVDDPAFGRISSANITSGAGSAVTDYTDRDWVRALRHGVAPDGRPLLLMPANELIQLGREDLVAVIAYVKQVPPVDNEPPEQKVGPIARMLHLTQDDFPLLNVGKVDHSMSIPEVPVSGVNPEFGRYVAIACQGCHGSDLASPAPGPPDTPPPTDLSLLGEWSEDDFLLAVREGIRPNGDTLHSFMPRWESPTDEELLAVWSFIQTLEPTAEPSSQ